MKSYITFIIFFIATSNLFPSTNNDDLLQMVGRGWLGHAIGAEK